MMRASLALLAAGFVVSAAAAQDDTSKSSSWRAAADTELQQIIPERAPVEQERIETEMRSASGIMDGKGKFIAGVVLITAGYSAEGKYSHFLVVQSPIRIGDLALAPGDYVFGWRRGDDFLSVHFYQAASGKLLGTVKAPRTSRSGRVEAFRIHPPSDHPAIQIGRFAMPYTLLPSNGS